MKISNSLAAADFFELLIDIDILFLIAGEQHTRCKAPPILQLEKISSVERNFRAFVIKIRSCQDRIRYIECRTLVVESLRRSLAQKLGILFKEIDFSVDGRKHSFVIVRCRLLRELVCLIFLL